MEAIAKAKNIRQSAKKMNFVLQSIRDLSVDEALKRLSFINKKAAFCISKTLASAVSNFYLKDTDSNADTLFIKEAYVNQGPTMKRFRPAAMGRAVPIRKRTSHLTIIISNKEL